MSLLTRLHPKRLATILATAVSMIWPAVQARAAPSLEYEVKANYLYKFIPFVEWPPPAFPEPSTPLTICVAGEDPFGSDLDDAVRGQSYQGRHIIIRRLALVTRGTDCNVLYVGRLAKQQPSDALKIIAGEPILTVTDRSNGNEGAMISFVMADGRVYFDIDEAAVRVSGLTLSSKLLGLAISHRRAG